MYPLFIHSAFVHCRPVFSMWYRRQHGDRRPDPVSGEDADSDDLYIDKSSCHRGTFLYNTMQELKIFIYVVEADFLKVI